MTNVRLTHLLQAGSSGNMVKSKKRNAVVRCETGLGQIIVAMMP